MTETKNNIPLKQYKGISDAELSARPKIDELDARILKTLLNDARVDLPSF
jgi:hypothetical protein